MDFPKSPISIRLEEGTSQPCEECKWEIAHPTDPTMGNCTVSRTGKGAIWQRLIRDIHNMTCDKFEKGELSFRDQA